MVRWVWVAVFLFLVRVGTLIRRFALAGLVLEVIYHRVQLLGRQVGLLEGLAPLTMQQGHLSRFPNVFRRDLGPPFVGGDGARCLVHHDIGPHTVYLVFGAYIGDQLQYFFADLNLRQQHPAGRDAFPFFLFGLPPLLHEREGVGFVGDTPPDDLPALLGTEDAIDFHRQTEPVQQLGPQVALFRVHGAHQNEIGGVADGDSFPLHVVAAHGGGIQQNVDQVVVEEVNFVNVENAPVSGGYETRLEAAVARFDGLLDV